MKENTQLTEQELEQVNGGHHGAGHEYFWKIQRARNSFRKSATVGIKKEGGSNPFDKNAVIWPDF